jgi:hypothetical protein
LRRPVQEVAMMSEVGPLLDVILNLSRYHREHEKFYAQAPLQQAIGLQQASRVLKTLADRWSQVEPGNAKVGNPYLGCEDLNETATIQSSGVLFMEGEGEPPEISRLKRDVGTMSDDFGETGRWLSEAMRGSWDTAASLVQHPALASVLGERHRIIANDWEAANLSSLVCQLLRRAVDILERIDFSPAAVRSDLAEARVFADYLYSASELIDRAADLAGESAALVHDNERRWRIFRERVRQIAEAQPGGKAAAE